MHNPYQILEIEKNASPQEIKRAYLSKIRAFPPETHPEEFKQIRQAYETLRDPQERQKLNLLEFQEPDLHFSDLFSLENLAEIPVEISWEDLWKFSGLIRDLGRNDFTNDIEMSRKLGNL